MKNYEKNWRHTYMHCSHSCKISEWKEISCALYKKDKMSGQNRSKNTFLKRLILSFLHRVHRMSFRSEKNHECEQLIYVSPFFSKKFIMFYYFFIFPKKTGACELGCHCEFPFLFEGIWIELLFRVPPN